MIDNQPGRRNLTERQMSYLRGERYKLEKQKIGGNQYARKTDPQFRIRLIELQSVSPRSTKAEPGKFKA